MTLRSTPKVGQIILGKLRAAQPNDIKYCYPGARGAWIGALDENTLRARTEVGRPTLPNKSAVI